jgi:hypothetical protein
LLFCRAVAPGPPQIYLFFSVLFAVMICLVGGSGKCDLYNYT